MTTRSFVLSKMIGKIRCIGIPGLCSIIVVLYVLIAFSLYVYRQNYSVTSRPISLVDFSLTGEQRGVIGVPQVKYESNESVPLLEALKKKLGGCLTQDKQKDGSLSSNPSSLFSSENVVRNCLTRDVIGRVVPGVPTEPLKTVVGPTIEDSQARRKSFVKVFESHAWGHNFDMQNRSLDASGPGSTLYWTQEMIGSLHILVNDLKQAFNLTRVRILDVPCGDFTWMQRFLSTRNDVDYVGVDIVPAIIENHKKTFLNSPWKFRLGDVVVDKILTDEDEARKRNHGYTFDIIHCRAVAQHLHTKDALQLFTRLSSIGARVLVTTQFSGEPKNEELVNDAGRFRRLNIELPPFSFAAPLCMIRDGAGIDIIGDQAIGIWKLPLLQVKDCTKAIQFRYIGVERHMYSCSPRST